MAIDIFKSNLTEPEAQKLLDQETRGKVFEDGSYRYRIFASFNSNVGLGSSVGLIITILNIPDIIGPDLIKYALTRISVILRNFKNKDLKFLVHKIWIDEYGHDINFERVMNANKEVRFFYLNLIKDVDSVYSAYDLKAQNEKFARKTKKVETMIDHFNEHFKLYEYDIDRFIATAALPDSISKRLKGLKVGDILLHCKASLKTNVDINVKSAKDNNLAITYFVTVEINQANADSRDLYAYMKSLPGKTIVEHILRPVSRDVKNYIFTHTVVELNSVIVKSDYADGSLSYTYHDFD